MGRLDQLHEDKADGAGKREPDVERNARVAPPNLLPATSALAGFISRSGGYPATPSPSAPMPAGTRRARQSNYLCETVVHKLVSKRPKTAGKRQFVTDITIIPEHP